MSREWLRITPVAELARGDQFVKPEYLQVYQTDREGWASLRADAGTRFSVLSLRSGILAARREDGTVLMQSVPARAELLKVVER